MSDQRRSFHSLGRANGLGKNASKENDFPESGALFMASRWTRQECLERNLFGLPAKYIDFVGKIKIGMLLFLFDFDSKELHGVFEASSDGGLNLVPDAYKSSNMKFPAQVHVNILWHCAPLKEAALRVAIRENYYAVNKFRFGLSTEQVCRLLILFNETKLSLQRSHMREGYYQRPNKIATLLDERCPVKSLPKSMPKKLASVVVCDPKLTLELAESEDPLQREHVVKLAVCSPSLDEPIDDNTGYQVYEHQDEEKNHMSRNSRDSVLYSGNKEGSLSVFNRLGARVNAQTERLGKNTNSENIKDSLKILDTKHTVWHSHGEKASINTSVVSGLGNDVKMSAKNEQPENFEQPENLSDTNLEICKDGKRKGTFLADEQQKRECLRKTMPCDELSAVPIFSEESCKTETNVIVSADAAVVTGSICGGDEESVDDKLDHSIQLRTPIEMLLAQYNDYLSRSRTKDQSDMMHSLV